MPSVDEKYIKRCLEIAKKGAGYVSPNPMVGAVVVSDGEIIAEGYHRFYGGPHAEVEALKCLTPEQSESATLYLNLEPCCHWGKTPPCTELILKKRIPRLVVGMIDPNPQVNCSGIETLRAQGVEVKVGVLEKQCRELNFGYIKHRESGIPAVILKTASTLDGRIGTVTKDSRWITSKAARTFSHQLRADYDAILVGIGTVLTDNPMLTVRHVEGNHPLRVILDSKLRIPLDAKVLQDQDDTPTLVFTRMDEDNPNFKKLQEIGIEVVTVSAVDDNQLSLGEILKHLGDRGVTSLMVEGGATIFTSFLRQRLVDRLLTVIAPKVIGANGVPVIGNLKIKAMAEVEEWKFRRVKRLGPDVLLEIIMKEY